MAVANNNESGFIVAVPSVASIDKLQTLMTSMLHLYL